MANKPPNKVSSGANEQPDDSPDWSLLPYDPVGFFALDEGFDRSTLKRAYNRLLRRYKPEKHPEEFQRLRAAYEELERALRYGQQASQPPPLRPASEQEPQPTTSDAGPRPDAHPTADFEPPVDRFTPTEELPLGEVLARRLEAGEATPTALYAELQARPNKTIDDYYALAILSDAQQESEPLAFLRWLLRGLAEPADAMGLGRMAYGFLASQVPLDQLPAALVLCSESTDGDSFYALTEGGWDRLLREGDFAHFRETLSKCEENLASATGGSAAIAGRIAFYLHTLRRALWKDPTDWKDQTLDYVEENFDQIPEHLINDLDGLAIVREYLATRDAFLAEHPVRQQVDKVLEACFTGDPLAADRLMLTCQLRMAAEPELVAAVFPPGDSTLGPFFNLWGWVTADTVGRWTPNEEAEPDIALWRGRAIDLLYDLKHGVTLDSMFWNFTLIVIRPVYGAAALVATIATFLSILTAWGPRGPLPEYIVVLAIVASAGVAIGGVIIWLKVIKNWFCSWFSHRMARRMYRRTWRPEMFAFARRSLLDYYLLRDLTAHVASQHDDERTWISHFVHQDYGLAIYTASLRFLS